MVITRKPLQTVARNFETNELRIDNQRLSISLAYIRSSEFDRSIADSISNASICKPIDNSISFRIFAKSNLNRGIFIGICKIVCVRASVW